METVTLSTKGQVVLPKRVRDALRLKAGQRMTIAIEGRRIVLEPAASAVPSWQPLNPSGVSLTADELCQAVDLKRDVRRR
ncbi:MAG TPA: AbrB/MazE/SpoVT family DNA-binding domain-containing protein [Rubrivivax sp.]|nr:AbrB/MazE/SpoVT family DNA-binding domain-containing protein [Rubrivivax sp.]